MAGERSGRLVPLDRYLLWLCRRGGRLGPQCSPTPKGSPRGPPSPPGPIRPNGPAPRLPEPLPPPRIRSESGLSRSRLNEGLSTNNNCHSYKKVWERRRCIKMQRSSILILYATKSLQSVWKEGSTYLRKMWSCVIKVICTTVQKTEGKTTTFTSNLVYHTDYQHTL